jgi:iron complex outermembrane receptor protein/outer membrane receptor for ferric coprogen and ferric-rhodotorulic acid
LAQTANTASTTNALPEVRVTDTGDSSTEATGQYTARTLSIGKMGESVRETPQSVSVITRQQLDDRNLTKLEDAVKLTTGVTVTRLDGAGNYNTIQSRGFDIGAILLDGVPISQGANYATALDAAIYDRFEVLRGPAGLLQGGGEPGGSINLVRKRALKDLQIGANLQAGSYGMKRADIDVTGSLNAAGTLRGRAIAVTDHRDSYIDTLFNNKDLGYGTLELDITSSTTLSVGYTHQRVRAAVDQGLPSYANGQLLDVPVSTAVALRANRQDLDTTDAFAELEHRLDNGGLVKVTARDVTRESFYRSGRANSAASATGAVAMQTVDYQQEAKDRNYDAYITSPFAFAGRTHRVLFGASHREGETYDGNYAYGPNLAFNVFQPNYDLAYPTIMLPGYTGITKKTEDGLYGQVQFGLTDQLKLLAGGRLAWAKVAVRNTSDGKVTSTSDPGRQFIPTVAALYDIQPGLTAYASYSETMVVQTNLDAAGQLLKPRTGEQIEFGLKGEYLNKRLQTHMALFRIEDRNRAVTDPVVSTASIAGGEVRSQGMELEVSGQVAPGWDVLAGYAYTDTEYVKAPVAQQGQVFSPITPRHSVNLFTRYAFRNDTLKGLSVGGGLAYKSEFYAQSGTLRLVSGDYAVFNAQAGYQINDNVSLNLTIDNLFDKKYYEKVSGVGRQNFYGAPRTLALAMRMRY